MKHSKRLTALEQARPAATIPAWRLPAFLDSLDRIYGAGDRSEPAGWAEIEAEIDRVYGANEAH